MNICPEEYKPICMKNCNSIWKDHKNKLKAKYFKPRSSDPNLKDDVPMHIVPSQWEQLVEYWRTSDAEVYNYVIFMICKHTNHIYILTFVELVIENCK